METAVSTATAVLVSTQWKEEAPLRAEHTGRAADQLKERLEMCSQLQADEATRQDRSTTVTTRVA